MVARSNTILATCGREVGEAEIEHACEVLRLCPGLSRQELALTLCEHWGWTGATGDLQRRSCIKLLELLEKQGRLRLPEKDKSKQRKPRVCEPIAATTMSDPQKPVACGLAELQPVWLEIVSGKETTRLWNEYIGRYHPLGYKPPFGCRLRYFVSSERGRLGCIMMGAAAVALAARDEWIGWSKRERLSHLPWVINNQRLLLFPWVTVPHLVSHVLGQLARRVQADWEARWGYRPVLMETFVDPEKYRGVGYRAAGWQLLGRSTGEGISRGRHTYQTTPKLIFVRPLVPDFREQLGSAKGTDAKCASPQPKRKLRTVKKADDNGRIAKRSGGDATITMHARRL